jgi:hypothetical protein
MAWPTLLASIVSEPHSQLVDLHDKDCRFKDNNEGRCFTNVVFNSKVSFNIMQMDIGLHKCTSAPICEV